MGSLRACDPLGYEPNHSEEGAFECVPEPMQAFLSCGNDVFKELEAMDSIDQHLAWALLDMLRMSLATTRLCIVMVGMDAGKSSFLEHVFSPVKTAGAGYNERNRTRTVSLLRHPQFIAGFRPVFLVDVPGYGDAVEERNAMVRWLSQSLFSLGPLSTLVWMHEASKDEHRDSDKLLKIVCPHIHCVMITHLDIFLARLFKSLLADLQNEGFDFDDRTANEKQRERELCLLRDLKGTVEGNITRVCEPNTPRMQWTAIDNRSWLYDGDDPNRFAEEKPKHMVLKNSEIRDYFGVHNKNAVRQDLDKAMGLTSTLH